MEMVLRYMEDQSDRLTGHPFFVRMNNDDPLPTVLGALYVTAFYVMAFQDILRINASGVNDPALRKIARHHLGEDSGHDKWFLHDLRAIRGSILDLEEVFDEGHRATREMAYALLTETMIERPDIERIVLIHTLEAAGQAFFPQIVAYLARNEAGAGFKYFSQSHLDVEKSHEIVEQKMQRILASIELSAEARQRCLSLVDRCFDAFVALFDAVELSAARETPAGAL
ncbi:hypothetical protein [Microtetraspora fusca]|uniref:hypothetical protein n=1 Tax=Microtetraspora fusca TaxID=1997 RepID=UPI00082F9565|nr:hypothetical protein [Microtetraspora fusca]